MHNFHRSIIRAYDIRGIYQKTLFDIDAFFVGKAFASYLHKNKKVKIAVACDGRQSSPALKAELIRGLIESGLEVYDVGLGPTPMLYFSVYHLNCDAGIMVTGSHNPKDHNGFKMMVKDGVFFGEDIAKLAQISAKGDFVDAVGKIDNIDVEEAYVARLLQDCLIAKSESELLDEVDEFTPKKKLKIAWDAGNGAAAEIMNKLTQRIAAEHILLFNEIDGTFPNHHPDPTEPKNLRDLIEVVTKENCDLGIAFDGDGDRIGVVNKDGKIIWGDQLLLFFALDILSKKPKATVIADVKASNFLFEGVNKAGGNAIMWKTGHSFIKAKMKEVKADLAGEMSGHIFFADEYYGFDDALYAAVRLINICLSEKNNFAQMCESLPKTFSTPEIRIECSEDNKFSLVADIARNLERDGVQFSDIDGVRVNKNGGWWLLRASNTQAVLVARCEAKSQEELEILISDLRRNLNLVDSNLVVKID